MYSELIASVRMNQQVSVSCSLKGSCIRIHANRRAWLKNPGSC